MTLSRPVTLEQVAERAKVSRAAASFALSGRPGVSDATRARVLRIADELGYSPNRVARNLRTSASGIIAVYLPPNVSTMNYYMEATFGIIDQAEATGRVVTLVPHSADATRLANIHADGVIALDPVDNDPTLSALLDTGLPLVSGERMPAGLPSPAGQVVSDHTAPTTEILDLFAENGAIAPAVITAQERMSWVIEIENAYLRWCSENGVVPRLETASLGRLAESTRRATRTLLKNSGANTTDAILALTDGSVVNVVTSAVEFGRSVGDDLLVAAAVDSPILAHTDPAVTAVDLRPREFGRTCMSTLERALQSAHHSRQIIAEVVATQVIHRASTGRNRREDCARNR